MSLKRIDYLTNDEIYIASLRNNRPISHKSIQEDDLAEKSKVDCPFCEHNDHVLGDITVYDEQYGIRFVKNLYPVVDGDDGIHEVVIESKNHMSKLQTMDSLHIARVLQLIQQRVEYMYETEGIQYVQVFKNEGEHSGASLYHTHWQIINLRSIPHKVDYIAKQFEKYYKENSSCYLCDNNEKNIIIDNESIKVVVPYAQRSNYTVRIMPKQHISNFFDIDDGTILEIAHTIKKMCIAYEQLKLNSYNILLYTSANKLDETSHCYIEMMPRVGRFAGFELSTNSYITTMSSEECCEVLKGYIE